MTSLKEKVVLITGASSGIGRACAEQFGALGARLILIARRIDRVEKLISELKHQYGTEALSLQLDVRNKSEVKNAIESLPDHWRTIDILINNAGLALTTDKMQDANSDNWDVMIDTNIKGLLYVTHAILPAMVKRESGHIINIGSIAGHECYPAGNVYSATKHAVRAISQSLRLDLLGTPIRISEVAPGAVHTEFSEVRWQDKKRSDDFYKQTTPLTANDIADSIVYCATRPAHANIAELVILPTAQASANYLHKNS